MVSGCQHRFQAERRFSLIVATAPHLPAACCCLLLLPGCCFLCTLHPQDPTYKPLLGQLARIAFFSAAMHQLMFTIFSTLPFAVGQPQDVGLIFLSSMATGVADIGRQQGLDSAVVVGTALLTLTLGTVVVGIMTMLVGELGTPLTGFCLLLASDGARPDCFRLWTGPGAD